MTPLRDLHRRFGVGLALAAGLVVSVPSLAHATVGPVAQWNMDDLGLNGHTMTDASGNGNNGSTTDIALGPGFSGSRASYVFNGQTSVVVVPNDNGSTTGSLNPGSQDFAITLSVNFTKLPPHDYDLLRKGNDPPDYKIEISPDGKASCFFNGSTTSAVVRRGPPLNDEAWHTITCQKTSTKISVTVDGLTRTKSVNVGPIANGSDLSIGSKTGVSSCTPTTCDIYNGLMDDVSISLS